MGAGAADVRVKLLRGNARLDELLAPESNGLLDDVRQGLSEIIRWMVRGEATIQERPVAQRPRGDAVLLHHLRALRLGLGVVVNARLQTHQHPREEGFLAFGLELGNLLAEHRPDNLGDNPRDLGPRSFAREAHVRWLAFEHAVVQVAHFVRRSVPAMPLDVVLVVRVVARLMRIEPVPEVRAALPGKMEIEMQHHRQAMLACRGECAPNAVGQLRLDFKGRIGQAETQQPSLAVALHADPLGQFPGFLRLTPEDEVFRFIRRGRPLVIRWRGRTAWLTCRYPGKTRRKKDQPQPQTSDPSKAILVFMFMLRQWGKYCCLNASNASSGARMTPARRGMAAS